ncbi:hypothetical protein IAU60_005252 [Kwoniella sp. DSM 27419]
MAIQYVRTHKTSEGDEAALRMSSGEPAHKRDGSLSGYKSSHSTDYYPIKGEKPNTDGRAHKIYQKIVHYHRHEYHINIDHHHHHADPDGCEKVHKESERPSKVQQKRAGEFRPKGHRCTEDKVKSKAVTRPEPVSTRIREDPSIGGPLPTYQTRPTSRDDQRPTADDKKDQAQAHKQRPSHRAVTESPIITERWVRVHTRAASAYSCPDTKQSSQAGTKQPSADLRLHLDPKSAPYIAQDQTGYVLVQPNEQRPHASDSRHSQPHSAPTKHKQNNSSDRVSESSWQTAPMSTLRSSSQSSPAHRASSLPRTPPEHPSARHVQPPVIGPLQDAWHPLDTDARSVDQASVTATVPFVGYPTTSSGRGNDQGRLVAALNEHVDKLHAKMRGNISPFKKYHYRKLADEAAQLRYEVTTAMADAK